MWRVVILRRLIIHTLFFKYKSYAKEPLQTLKLASWAKVVKQTERIWAHYQNQMSTISWDEFLLLCSAKIFQIV